MGLLVLFVVLTISQMSLAARIPRRFPDTNILSSPLEDRGAVHKLLNHVKDMQKSMFETNKTMIMFRQKLSDLQIQHAQLLKSRSTVATAFYVSLRQDIHPPEVNRPILFNQLILNTARNYDTNDGVFTANVPGLYSFSWSLATYYGHYIFAALMHGNIESGRTFTGDAKDISMATGTAILNLVVGDTVRVVVGQSSNGAVIMASMSSFSGFFISANE
ncbi:adiponectin-like [Mizuhopecten yessoensis]|uniref:adiponectin-like n=1 Tax=Mizuhopecten yessoensis TaxID=6573 RepID=UPI000B45E539|nr:adiponectin-like [Mizuhopecten yessoensis]